MADVLLLSVMACSVSLILTGILVRFLRARAIVDLPNDRSNHTQPTPRGGGIAILAATLPLWWWLDMPLLLLALTFTLALVSWWDDRRGLSPLVRLIAQAMAVMAGLSLLPHPPMHAWLPPVLGWMLAGFAWLWFINLFNFMDGIDGISAVETLCITVGLALLTTNDATALWVLAAATVGFLYWNWSPAKIFLGDVGSVSLGFVLGFFLLSAATHDALTIALLLPAYYVTDATVTLLRRALRGEKIWQAHSQHAYQRAVRAGWSHRKVVSIITAVNMLLLLLAFATQQQILAEAYALVVGYGMSMASLVFFSSRQKS